MTRRFPRTGPVIPDDLLATLVENASLDEDRPSFDPFPVPVVHVRHHMRLITQHYPAPFTSLSGVGTVAAELFAGIVGHQSSIVIGVLVGT